MNNSNKRYESCTKCGSRLKQFVGYVVCKNHGIFDELNNGTWNT